jgi:hypothetical protein
MCTGDTAVRASVFFMRGIPCTGKQWFETRCKQSPPSAWAVVMEGGKAVPSCAILYTEVVTLFAPAMFVPRTLYACLAVLRCIFAFSPGYIHPDEWFQHGEPLAGASPHPCRIALRR